MATVRAAHASQPGFAFLEVPTGTRASGLGGAFASLGEGDADGAAHEPSTESALPAAGGYQQIRAGTGR